jgi:hypothetical protein
VISEGAESGRVCGFIARASPAKARLQEIESMKDRRGVYYYPFPDNREVHMYVRQRGGAVEFRLWNRRDPDMWVDHGWVPYEAVRQAADRYDRKHFDPNRAYDLVLARALLAEEE